ncbi:STAS domain-containing protein [Sediminimonas sp.]|jgi:anti-sigma B factor antagonist|uniref:STAS domain-containing protein n=1 Tax=Sediminimonas sp. TaxID=2823379 RepID=UPI0025F28B82|nr:STAS domain-containing protein [Sediminimonas sp.]
MEIHCRDEGDIRLLHVAADRIDAAVAIAFKDRMRALSDGAPETVILDLSDVSFIDSSGLGSIVAAMKQLGSDRKMQLAGLTPNVARVFRLTRMDKVFAILDMPEEGRAANGG